MQRCWALDIRRALRLDSGTRVHGSGWQEHVAVPRHQEAHQVDAVLTLYVTEPAAEARLITPRRGLALVVGAAVIFFASWWNAYVPPTSGGEAVLMARWAKDYLPYRDYFYQAPPGVPMLVAALSSIFGPHLLVTLAFGVLLRIGGACAAYGLLLRVARPSYAAVGSVVALLVSSTDISDTPFYYNHVGAALILAGTYFGAAAATGTRASHHLAAIAAGVLVTFAVAVKQTMIFGASAAFVALVVLAFPRPRTGWLVWLLGLTLGAAITLGGLWVWLVSHDVWDTMLTAMQQAPEGKGGIAASLLRPISLLSVARDALYASVAAWIVIGIFAILWMAHWRHRAVKHGVRLFLGVVVAVCLTAVVGVPGGRAATLFLTAVGWWGSLGMAVLHVGAVRAGRENVLGRTLVALGILSFGIGYSFAVSWPLFENIAFPGLAVVVAATLERPPSAHLRRWVVAIGLLAFAAMGLSVYRKASFPHSWGYWLEPPLYTARGHFAHPAFRGIRLSETSSELYAEVARVASQYSQPDEPIYVFPNLPILYAIAERRPATFGLAHWIDVCPDFLGKEDAVRLRANPPKLLIVRKDPPGNLAIEERFYRGGRPSSVRDVLAALEDIRPLYDHVATFNREISNPIVFYVRREP